MYKRQPLEPPPPDETNRFQADPRAARLGQMLFFDARVSANGEVSCATCHVPERAFTDGRPVARGLGEGHRNTPTVVNVSYSRWFFWDGRADTAWAQALQPLESEHELGASRLQLAHLLHGDPELREAYEGLFGALPPLGDGERFPREARPVPGDPEHPHQRAWLGMEDGDRAAVDRVLANAAKALAAYEHRLVSRRSPFDRFAEGLVDGDPEKLGALGPRALEGLRLFLGKAGCRQCHVGPLFSDGEFHNVGVPPRGGGRPRDPARYAGARAVLADPFNARGAHSDDPQGPRARRLGALRNPPESWGQYKTPSLRNVAATAPYMHAGQFASLREVVEYYSTLEGAVVAGHHRELVLQPLALSEREIDALVAFLESLTDLDLPAELLAPPARDV